MTKKHSTNKLKAATVTLSTDPNAMKKLKLSLGLVIAAFAFILYAQSIASDYTLDDHPAIDLNKITTKGFTGIPTLLKTDYWFGYKEDYRGPIYRPTSLVMFAIEWQFFPNSPHIYHMINVLLFALSCWVLFLLLCKLFSSYNLIFPFICCLLYASHPIHTEVINSIKSRDEILCFLFGILSITIALKSIETANNSIIFLLISAMFFFLSLLSKETGITFLVTIPLTLFVFTKLQPKKLILISLTFLITATIYLIIRSQVLQSIEMNTSNSYLYNSIVAAPDFISRQATVFFTLQKYILLLIFPHPLTCDYNFSQIPLQSLSDFPALTGILVNIFLVIYALINIRKKSIIAYGILFYFIALSPVSNVFFLNGATMAERFMYTPSLGYCIIATYFIIKFTNKETVQSKYQNLTHFFSHNSASLVILAIILGLYSLKTFSRNMDWKDNFTIFNHDVETSNKSATAHCSVGSALLLDLFPKEHDKDKKSIILDKAIIEYNKAIEIYANYSVAYLNLGIVYYNKGDYQSALKSYEKARQLFPSPNIMLLSNLGNLYGTVGQYEKGLIILDSAIKYQPDYAEAYDNRGFVLAGMGKYEEALKDFKKAIELNPKLELAYQNAGSIFNVLKQYDKALEYLNKAIVINPSDIQNYTSICSVYQNMGNAEKAKEYLEKANTLQASQQK